MRRKFFLLFAAVLLIASARAAENPKLIVAIAVDQFRYDYLLRFRSEYKEGLDRLLTRGAVFTNARYEHFPTVTAIGHSTFLSGAPPSMSGIVGNDWFDRESGKNVTSVSDDSVKILGGAGEGGASPRRMLVSTLGDELKMSNGNRSRVIGVSIKDRSAILPSGHMGNGAFWFDAKSGNFVSSTFYFAALPAWVTEFNASRPGDKYKGAVWMSRKYPDETDEKLYRTLPDSPFGNELIEAFTERAVEGEKLGQRGVTDLLAVSFSSNDYVGHALGPDAPEVHDISVRTDQVIGKLFQFLDGKVGMQNVLVVMTADHGVSPVPEVNQARKMPGGRMPGRIVRDTVQAALTKKYGAGDWISSPSEHSLYLNLDLIREKKLDRAEVNNAAAEAALTIPHVFRVYTREQLMQGTAMEDQVGRRVMNGFYVRRSADVFILLEPYWMFSAHGTTHGTTFSYDAHVPVIFMGSGIKAGRFDQSIAVNDIAPTLATLLGVETPSGSVGRVLGEIFEK
ncbi:MAG: type phosphodiesterase/nucleotide pyrophosphatase [Bryobacterales bacterium]|nr:type phosphodiesterase/nucleotide pyrophosphatase [Bryobacterales bacterium]